MYRPVRAGTWANVSAAPTGPALVTPSCRSEH